MPNELPDLHDMKGLARHYGGSEPESRCIQLLAEAAKATRDFGSNLRMPNYQRD
jgi:hypothetical protein